MSKRFKLVDSTDEPGDVLKCRVTEAGNANAGRLATIRLSPSKVDAAHSNGNELHLQSGDAFTTIVCRDAPQAMRFAAWLRGEVSGTGTVEDDIMNVSYQKLKDENIKLKAAFVAVAGEERLREVLASVNVAGKGEQ
jgi:hypothetical protein